MAVADDVTVASHVPKALSVAFTMDPTFGELSIPELQPEGGFVSSTMSAQRHEIADGHLSRAAAISYANPPRCRPRLNFES
jgi:hypothetical protein